MYGPLWFPGEYATRYTSAKITDHEIQLPWYPPVPRRENVKVERHNRWWWHQRLSNSCSRSSRLTAVIVTVMLSVIIADSNSLLLCEFQSNKATVSISVNFTSSYLSALLNKEWHHAIDNRQLLSYKRPSIVVKTLNIIPFTLFIDKTRENILGNNMLDNYLYKEAYLENFWNGVHLEEEEKEDLEILGCRKWQQEWQRRELTWEESTENNGVEK